MIFHSACLCSRHSYAFRKISRALRVRNSARLSDRIVCARRKCSFESTILFSWSTFLKTRIRVFTFVQRRFFSIQFPFFSSNHYCKLQNNRTMETQRHGFVNSTDCYIFCLRKIKGKWISALSFTKIKKKTRFWI